MGLNYGSEYDISKLANSEIGFDQPAEESGLISFFRTLITIAEIGLSLTGIGVLAEVAVGLTAGAVNEGLDIAEGNGSVVNTLFNFGTPLIGGAFVGGLNKKVSAQVLKDSVTLEEISKDLFKTTRSFKQRAEILVERGIAKTSKEANALIGASKSINKLETTPFQRFNYGQRILENQMIMDRQISRSESRLLLQRLQNAKRQIRGFKEATQTAAVQKRILRTIGFTDSEVRPFLEIINNGSLSAGQRYSATLGFIRNTDVLTTGRYQFKAFAKALDSGDILLNEAYQIPLARQFNRLANKNFSAAELDTEINTFSRSKRTFRERIVKALKNPGSRDFNDLIVQPTQALFDANDAGRAPVEYTYRIFKKQLKTILKDSEKTIKKAVSLEEAFVKTGGTIVDSNWQLGYKVVNKSPIPGGQSLTQITYGKDTGKIRHVYVFASDFELERYIADPGHYYNKHWAFSKGGKALSLGGLFGSSGFNIGGLSRVGKTALGFLPINELRNMLSIVSNVVENSSDMAKGVWTTEWKDKFVASFKRAGINRTFRLAAKGVIDPVVGKAFGKQIGAFVGREAQRLGTNVLAPLVKNAVAGKPLTTGLTKANLANKFATAAESNLRRLLRTSRGNASVVNQQLSVRRKLGQVNRIPNAVTVGRNYKNIKFNK